MKNFIKIVALWIVSCQALAGGNGDPMLTNVLVDKLEYRSADAGTPLFLDADAWIG